MASPAPSGASSTLQVDRRVGEQRAQCGSGLPIEVLDITLDRHRQHRIDLAARVERGPGDQQIRALGHAGHDPQLGIRQAPLQVGQQSVDFPAQLGHALGMQIAMAGHADDQR